jgi:nitroimidazol reductase NimA-like FMN-containing flavoprotein (pyridoxamine 5'-phosphate oxidase superfamily)
MSELQKTERTQVKRRAQRGVYDRETVNALLDEGLVCHIGFLAEGTPLVIPTGYGRRGEKLYIHGSSVSGMLGALAGGIDACVTVTLLDGIVLARAVFHHSMNYRSVVLLGKATLIVDPVEKLVALEVITEHLVPGRWDDARKPTPQELDATAVLSFPIEEASAKIRTGPPIDKEADYGSPIWAGVLPLALTASEAITDERCLPGATVPDYIRTYKRGTSLKA